jgi:hypothetical protein
VVYENRWVFSVVDAWRGEGARLAADGGLSPGPVGLPVCLGRAAVALAARLLHTHRCGRPV